MSNNDETQKIPAVNSPGGKPQETSKSPVRGFDPSKAMFVPSDKNSATRQASPAEQNPTPPVSNTATDKNTHKPAERKPGTSNITDKATDIDSTMAIPVIDSSVKPEFNSESNPQADRDATAEIPVIAASKTADSDNPANATDVPQSVYIPDLSVDPKDEQKQETPKKSVNPQNLNSKKSRKWIYALCISIVSIVLCMAVITSYVFPKIIEEGGAAILQNVAAVVGEPPENVNVLLVGTDKDGYRTDTIMVASYDNDAQAVHIIQIPRDTYVKGNGRSDKKINSAYFSGIDTLKSEIFKAFGIEIHRYLAVELNGFVEIIDAIGGVEVDVPINMHYDDPVQDLHIHINKGLQVLDGKNAEGFVRYRKGNDGSSYPLGDIDRMKAQKQFVQNTVAKLVSIDGISKIPELISIVKDNIETDISTAEATSYATKILSLDSNSINFHTAPGAPLYKYGGWYYFIDGHENQTLVMNHFNGQYNKKSYSPIYFDLSEDANEAVSAPYSEYSSSDVSDDERYSYYSPENDMGYYDDEDSSASRVPVIDTGDNEDDDEDSSTTSPGSFSSSSRDDYSQSDTPSSSQSGSSSSGNLSSNAAGSTSSSPSQDDTPTVQTPSTPAGTLPNGAPEFDFD